MIRRPLRPTLFPYTTLFRSGRAHAAPTACRGTRIRSVPAHRSSHTSSPTSRSEEHTSELQSLRHLVCRLLLEKKNNANAAMQHLDTHDTPLLATLPVRSHRQ